MTLAEMFVWVLFRRTRKQQQQIRNQRIWNGFNAGAMTAFAWLGCFRHCQKCIGVNIGWFEFMHTFLMTC